MASISLYAGSTLPKGWVHCQGQTLPISEHEALYSLIGNTYGGDISWFNLPNLVGRVALGRNDGGRLEPFPEYRMGEHGGSEMVRLGMENLPEHSHAFKCAKAAGRALKLLPTANFPATQSDETGNYSTFGHERMASEMVGTSGGNTAHDNMQPFIILNYAIRLDGEYPPDPEDEIALLENLPEDTETFVGTVQYFGGGYAPKNWMYCMGQPLKVDDYPDLFSVIGTRFGGHGSITFNLPDLRERVTLGAGETPMKPSQKLGKTGGQSGIILKENEIPEHNHVVMCKSWVKEGQKEKRTGSQKNPANHYPAVNCDEAKNYGVGGKDKLAPMHAETLASTGADPHENRMPFLALAPIICVKGEIPEF